MNLTKSKAQSALTEGECPNPPVNADARGRAAMCVGWPARAGYRAR
jgi:hypothetical protein